MHFDVWQTWPRAVGHIRFYRQCPMPGPGKLPIEYAEGKGNDKMSVISKGECFTTKNEVADSLKLVLELPASLQPGTSRRAVKIQ